MKDEVYEAEQLQRKKDLEALKELQNKFHSKGLTNLDNLFDISESITELLNYMRSDVDDLLKGLDIIEGK